MRKRSSFVAWFATLVIGAIGCSDDEGSTVDSNPRGVAGKPSSGGGAPASAGAPGKPGTAGAISAGVGGASSAPVEACKALPLDGERDEGAAGTCNGVSIEAEAVPVDVLVMMDRSQSMAQLVEGGRMTRWQALHDAVERFTEDPRAADIRAGIGFFSVSGAGDDARDCSSSAYDEPDVAIGLLAEVGPDLVAAMDGVEPGGLTPTVPALKGAILHAEAWARDNPGRATLVVLVTDGFPTQCESDPDQITQAARAGYEGSEHIRTFVIGVGDVAKFNLDNYARAGGTQRAYLTDAGDVTSSFVEALSNITSRALACEYELPAPPEGMKLDPDKVQIVYTPATGGAEEVPSITSLAACATNPNGGWYYDDPNQPSRISVCPCTCARFQAGRVDVRLGCKPRLGLR